MSRCNNGFRLRALAPAVMLGVMLAGCSDLYFDRRDTISLAAGDAVAINRVTQMIDPWPPASANKNIAFSGDRTQCAAERYRIGRVIPPRSFATSTVYGQGAAQASVLDVGCPPSAAGGAPPRPEVK